MAAIGRRPRPGPGTWSGLPDDLQARIFSTLTTAKDTAACRLVCKEWRGKAAHTLDLTRLRVPRREHDRPGPVEVLALVSSSSNLCVFILPPDRSLFRGKLHATALLHSLATSCPFLEHLSLAFTDLDTTGLTELALDRLFRGCRWLQRVTIEGSQLASIPEAISTLQHLHTLELLAMSDLEAVPRGLCQLAQLRTLLIKDDMDIQNWGPLAALTQLTELTLVNTSTYEVPTPDEVWQLTGLEDLCLHELELPLGTCARTIERLSALTSLEVTSCRVNSIGFASLPALRKLHLEECYNLGDLTEDPCVRAMPALESLTLKWCTDLRSLPKHLGRLPALQSLTVWNKDPDEGHNLDELPPSFRLLTGLTFLHLEQCELQEFPFSWADLSSLTEVRLIQAITEWRPLEPELEPFETLRGRSTSLRVLRLEQKGPSCPLPSVSGLVSLEELHLKMDHWLDPPDTIGLLTRLKKLHIEDGRYWELPESLGQLKALQELRLVNLSGLFHLPDSLGNLTALEQFHVLNCPNLQKLPASVARRITCWPRAAV